VIAHIAGLPIEETVIQLAPAGAAVISGFALVGWTWLSRLRRGQTRRR
jgi:hypothetical protein